MNITLFISQLQHILHTCLPKDITQTRPFKCGKFFFYWKNYFCVLKKLLVMCSWMPPKRKSREKVKRANTQRKRSRPKNEDTLRYTNTMIMTTNLTQILDFEEFSAIFEVQSGHQFNTRLSPRNGSLTRAAHPSTSLEMQVLLTSCS